MNLTDANIWEVIDKAQKHIVKLFPEDNSIAQKMALKELEKIASSEQNVEEKIATIHASFFYCKQRKAISIESNKTEDSVTNICDNYCSEIDKTTVKSIKTDEPKDAEAQFQLGKRYHEGNEVLKDDVEAVKWYRKAAEQGHAGAQNSLGLRYSRGEGVNMNQTEAVKWYRMAAEQGYARAQFNLALRYRRGEGVEKNPVEAVKWFRLAAEQGHAKAQYKLGECYYNGDGMEKDKEEAVKWLRKAAQQGNDNAKYFLMDHDHHIPYLSDNKFLKSEPQKTSVQKKIKTKKTSPRNAPANKKESVTTEYNTNNKCGGNLDKDDIEVLKRKAKQGEVISKVFNFWLEKNTQKIQIIF